MHSNELSPIPPGTVGAGLPVPGGLWGLLGSDIVASSGSGTHGPGLAVNDSLTPSLRYVYVLETRSAAAVVLYPDSSHEGPVPYSGTVRLYEQGSGELPGTTLQRSFSVSAAPAAPVITAGPLPQSVTEGAPATFSVAATGTGLAYQWQRNGSNITGATSATTASYTFTPLLVDSGAQFRAVVSNGGGSVTSTAAALTVNPATVAPQITTQPQALNVPDGAPATFTVAATGTAPLQYQWRANGANVAGANGSSYTISAAQQGDNGVQYTVVVSNAAGSVTSTAALLTVQAPVTSAPQIVAQPRSVSVVDGGTATFTVAAVGAAPLAYQWQRAGVNVPGATAAQLVVPAATLADHRAQYRVVVSNGNGTAISERAELLVPVVTLAEAKSGARIDDDRFDADIPRWVDTAIAMAEQYCDAYFTPKRPSFERTDWPLTGDTFPISGATSATASYWNGTAWAALEASQLVVFADGARTGVAPVAGTQWPALGTVAGGPRVRFSFVAGPTSAAELPTEVQHFVIAHVSLWADENRAAAPQAAQNFPWLYDGLQPLKRY